MIKINHRIVFWIFSILIIGMILLSCGCNQLLKFYFPQSFSVSKNEMTTNDPLQNAENYNYRIRAQNYADLVSYLPSNSTPVDLRIPNELAGYKVCEIEEGCFHGARLSKQYTFHLLSLKLVIWLFMIILL